MVIPARGRLAMISENCTNQLSGTAFKTKTPIWPCRQIINYGCNSPLLSYAKHALALAVMLEGCHANADKKKAKSDNVNAFLAPARQASKKVR